MRIRVKGSPFTSNLTASIISMVQAECADPASSLCLVSEYFELSLGSGRPGLRALDEILPQAMRQYLALTKILLRSIVHHGDNAGRQIR